MKKNNQNGFIHIIVYLLVFSIFVITLYACLDLLDLIDVPEEYSITKIISDIIEKSKNNEDKNQDGSQDGIVEQVNKIIEIENSEETSDYDFEYVSSQLEDYEKKYSNVEIEKKNEKEKYYYSQLDDYAKIIYQELEKNLDNMKSGTYNVKFGTIFDELLHEENGEEVLNNSFQLAINALNFDNPELFYIDISKLYLLTRITTKLWVTTYEVEIGASQGNSYLNSSFFSEEDVNNAINKLIYEKTFIRSKLSGNEESQVRGVHDYLIQNLEYDSSISQDNIYNIYGALINKYTVCEGYARAFKYLMDDLGIPCIIACGTAINSAGENESHAWNYVQLNGQWYAIDVTWDDPLIIGNGLVDRNVNYKYYLKGSNEFFTNHTEDGNIVCDSNFQYPTLSFYNY